MPSPGGADTSMRRPGRAVPRVFVPPLIVVALSVTILLVLNPWEILAATTPSGGDMGAHVYAPAFLRDVLLPSGRVLGWSQDWFAGFPVFYFYFPLPSLVIVLLDLVLPYGVAFKLVTVAGVVGLPAASYVLARALTFGRVPSAMAAAGATAFAFMESFSIYGGNIASTLAGEFSYSWSFTLGLVYLAYLVRAADGERKAIPRAVVLLALTALSHILTTVVLVLASLSVLPWRGALRRVVGISGWAFALTGFWSVPLIARIGIGSDMAWTPLSRWEEIFPLEIWLLLPIAAGGAVWAVRRTRRAVPLVVAALVPLIYFPLPNLLPSFFPDLFTDGRFKLWNGRLLPYWYFGVCFFAGIGVGVFVLRASRRLPALASAWWPRLAIVAGGVGGTWLLVAAPLPRWIAWTVGSIAAVSFLVTFLWRGKLATRSVLAGIGAAVLALGSVAGMSFVGGWARWNFEGYESKEAWPEYLALMQTIDKLEPGRVMWEYSKDQDKYGTPMALMLIPYWTGGTHPSMEGLFFESSPTTPFHFVNQSEVSAQGSQPVPGLAYHPFGFDQGVEHLEQFGVKYYVAYTDEARAKADTHPDLVRVADSPPFTVYELPAAPLVESAEYPVTVYDGAEPFGEVSLDWYDDLSLADRWMVADGPSEWPRVADLTALGSLAPLTGDGIVSDVVVDEERVSFHTTALGVPHLVKVSYFPNWRAEGARGPYLATPSFMVVVPTSPDVVLEFASTWAETSGRWLTAAGLLGFGAYAWWRRREVSRGDGEATTGGV